MICTISESLGSQGHLHITRTTDNVIYGLDTCTVCQNYTQTQTYSLRACSVAHLRHDIHKLKRVLSEALRTYEQMINMGIEEEERNGMFTNYKHQTVFNGNPVSLMQKYAAMHSMLHKISLNITVIELLVDQTLMTSFQQVLTGVICHLQTVLELESFRDDRHVQVTCRRSLTLSRDIEHPLSANSRINFTIYSLLTARDALNEINNAMDALFISLRL